MYNYYRINKLCSLITLLCFLLLSVCSCRDERFKDMVKYVNANSDVEVTYIEWYGNNKNKDEETMSVELIVYLQKETAHYSIERIDGLRNALNQYMIDDPNSFLNRGFHIVIWVENTYYYPTDSPKLRRCAAFSNMDSLSTLNLTTDLVNSSLCGFMFRPDLNDIKKLNSLTDIKYLWLLDDGYSISDNITFVNELKLSTGNLDELEVVYVAEYWYKNLNINDFRFRVEKAT